MAREFSIEESEERARRSIGHDDRESGGWIGPAAGGAGTALAVVYSILAAKNGGFKQANEEIANAIRGTRVGQYLRDTWHSLSPNSAAKAKLQAAGIKDYSAALRKLEELTTGFNRGEAGLTQESLQSATAAAAGYKDFRNNVANRYRSLRGEISTARDRLNNLSAEAAESNLMAQNTRDKVAGQIRGLRRDLFTARNNATAAERAKVLANEEIDLLRSQLEDATASRSDLNARILGILDPINFGKPITKREDREAIKSIIGILRQ